MKVDKKIEHPECYVPNDDPYPLCKGNGTNECKECCLYEDMPGPYDNDLIRMTIKEEGGNKHVT